MPPAAIVSRPPELLQETSGVLRLVDISAQQRYVSESAIAAGGVASVE